MDLDKIFKKIAGLSKKNKTPVYFVGGFVRDALMGREIKKDVDFVVVGSGIEFAKMFDEAMKQEGSLVLFEEFDTARYVVEITKSEYQISKQDQKSNDKCQKQNCEIRNSKFEIAKGEEGGNEEEEIVEIKDKEIEKIVFEFAGARSEKYKSESRKPAVERATLEEDLGRRDFTVNAMALASSACGGLRRASPGDVIDPFGGRKDIEEKILRTPLDPDKTFSDDPLRMMRAIRFAGQLGFAIEKFTLQAIYRNRERLKVISAERICEELIKMLACDEPSICLALMFQTHLLDLVLPEVARLDGVEEVFGQQHKNNLIHTFRVVDNIATRTDKVMLKFAGLLHDIGKPSTKKFLPRVGWSFYQHEHVGKKMVYQIAKRLRLAKADTDYLAKLVRWHQQPISLMDEGITDSAVRRLIVSLGDDLEDLLILGVSDITTGNPLRLKKRQENYDRLRKRIDEVIETDKLRAFQSPVRGEEIMEVCGLKPGPTVGKIKEAIEEAILDGVINNEYDEARGYFEKIKDEFLKLAQKWEKVRGEK